MGKTNSLGDGAPKKKFYEDFQIGEILDAPAKYITQTEHDLFCLITGHLGPHTNAELARSLGFKDKLVPGMLVLSLSNNLWDITVTPGEPPLFLGVNNARFTSPVFPGDTIKTQLEVIGKRDVAKWKEYGLVTFKVNFKNQDGMVVCEAETAFRFARKAIIEN